MKLKAVLDTVYFDEKIRIIRKQDPGTVTAYSGKHCKMPADSPFLKQCLDSDLHGMTGKKGTLIFWI